MPNLACCTEEDLVHALEAAHGAGATALDVFASHVLQAAAGDGAALTSPEDRSIIDSIRGWLSRIDEVPFDRLRATAARFGDLGLEAPVIEVLSMWPVGDLGRTSAEADAVCRVGALLGSTIAVAACLEPSADESAMREGLRVAADVAATYGLSVAVEWLPGTALPTMAAAGHIIEATDRPNVGLLLDSLHWHFQPGGPDWDTLERTLPSKVLCVQLADGVQAEVTAGRLEPASRCIPGTGDIDLRRLLATLASHRAEPLLVTEVFSSDLLQRLGPMRMACAVTDAARHMIATTSSTRPYR